MINTNVLLNPLNSSRECEFNIGLVLQHYEMPQDERNDFASNHKTGARD